MRSTSSCPIGHDERNMTPRETIRTLLDKKIPDRMGLYEHFWPETIPDY